MYNFELSKTLGQIKPFKENVEKFTHVGVFTFWNSLSNYTADNFNIVVLTDTGNNCINNFIYTLKSKVVFCKYPIKYNT